MNAAGPPRAPSWQRRRPWNTVDLLSLDFEATGLDFRRDTIVSFGAVPIHQGRVEVGQAVYQLVDPGHMPPSNESITVHGLRPVDLRGAPSIEAARVALGAAIDGRFLVTWWAGVEAAFLDKIFGGGVRRWLRRAVDVRDLVIALEGDAGRQLTLTAAAERFGVPVANPHHALDDALVTAQLLLVTASRLSRVSRTQIRDLQRLGLAPPVLTRPRATM
ncbi:MAG: 3'-5' exonuclease [Actinomycetota bacterium]|nr:3'-5' exonuclease [Actinomycetota bacterium]